MRTLAAMAQRIADDCSAPIRDRAHAVGVLHRLQHGLRIKPHEAWQVRSAHRRHRRWRTAAGELWMIA
jgi:hypothetical protein